ncbi:hypothetical protein DFQ01_109140 [Paenibacillus cellulosilyticus]|uniref:DUF5659 domain-containing protein n=1 Tax=Paenibacillus cellulosilyticus TaxID=375489 RepID=A0A2V2Z206_9BACL|nr:hypothetical protein DFQ01_109140 [Paenibacillus cellulosilyticus]
MTNNNQEYFYCYSTNLFRFLKMVKKINYICTALHERSFQQFWLFRSDEPLKDALREYRNNGLK